MAEHDTAWGLQRLEFEGGSIHLAERSLPIGRRVRLQILARDVSLALENQSASSIMNRLPATALQLAPAGHGAHVLVSLDVAGSRLLARITRKSADQLDIVPGRQVWAQIKAVALLD